MTSDSASRVTHSRRSLGLAILLLLGALAVVTALRAQEAPARDPATPPAEPAPAAPADRGKAEVGADDPATDSTGKGAPAAARSRGAASPGRFEPSEKVRADFDVSFPVDI